MQFVIVKTGTVQYRVNQKDYILTPGQVLFISSNCLHTAKAIGDEYASYICIDIHPRFFGEYHCRISQKYLSPFLASKALSAILISGTELWQQKATSLLLKLVRIYEEKSFLYELRLQQLCLELLGLLLESHRNNIEQPAATTIAEQERLRVILSYAKLCQGDASTLTVRDLSRENNCSVAALYKHFDSLEYLITVASVRFLDEYMREYAKILDDGTDFLKVYLDVWELFNHYAFARPDIYYRLFWGEDNSIFGNAFQDYFELFPFHGSEKYTAHYYTLLFNENIQERDFMMLRRIESAGQITGEDAWLLAIAPARNPSRRIVLPGSLLSQRHFAKGHTPCSGH